MEARTAAGAGPGTSRRTAATWAPAGPAGSIVPPPGRRLGAAAQLEEREDPERQDEQLHGHPGEQRPVLARGARRSSSTVRDTRGIESPNRMSAPTAAASRPSSSAAGVQVDGEHHPGSVRPFERPASARQAQPQEQAERVRPPPRGERLHALRGSSVRRRNPRLWSTASSKAWRVSASAPTPASTASVTAPIWNTTSRIGIAKVLHALIHDAEAACRARSRRGRGRGPVLAHELLGLEQLAGDRTRPPRTDARRGRGRRPTRTRVVSPSVSAAAGGVAVHQQRLGLVESGPGTGSASRTRTDPRGRASRNVPLDDQRRPSPRWDRRS